MAHHSGHRKTSRYNHAGGGQTESTGRFLDFYERQTIDEAPDDELFIIPPNLENRIDLIANVKLGNPRYSWVILLRNNDVIENPMVDLHAGKVIFIPSRTRLQSEILS